MSSSMLAVEKFEEHKAHPEQKKRSLRIKHFIGDYGILLILAVVMLVLTFTAHNFLTIDNLTNVVRQSSIVGLVAVGMTFVMITAGIDLSVGSVVGLAGILAAMAAPATGNAFLLPIVVGLAVGALVGFISGAMVVWGSILPFLATLAMMAIVRSATLVISGGKPVSDVNSQFEWLGAGFIGPIGVPVVIFLGTAAVAEFTLAKTRFGQHVYAVGGNEESSQKVGIPVRRILLAVYMISGLCAGLAGIVLTARLDGAAPLNGTGYELQAIAAVVIGGTSLFGGRGTIRGTILGVLLLGVVINGLNLLGVSSYYQQAVQGVILVIAVLLSRWKSD